MDIVTSHSFWQIQGNSPKIRLNFYSFEENKET